MGVLPESETHEKFLYTLWFSGAIFLTGAAVHLYGWWLPFAFAILWSIPTVWDFYLHPFFFAYMADMSEEERMAQAGINWIQDSSRTDAQLVKTEANKAIKEMAKMKEEVQAEREALKNEKAAVSMSSRSIEDGET